MFISTNARNLVDVTAIYKKVESNPAGVWRKIKRLNMYKCYIFLVQHLNYNLREYLDPVLTNMYRVVGGKHGWVV